MKTKLGNLLLIIGSVLLAAALGLFLYNDHQQREAGEASADVMPELVEQIRQQMKLPPEPSPTPEIVVIQNEDGETEMVAQIPVKEMRVERIKGYDYIGFLTIESLELELPVMSDWNYSFLQIAPCRYTGNLYADDLVIMAHNFRRHFKRISELQLGDRVSFTDMDGELVNFEVVAKEILQPTAVEEMTSGEYDLTLFTCTYGGRTRVTVRCDRVDE